jgi:hypothetical protein
VASDVEPVELQTEKGARRQQYSVSRQQVLNDGKVGVWRWSKITNFIRYTAGDGIFGWKEDITLAIEPVPLSLREADMIPENLLSHFVVNR